MAAAPLRIPSHARYLEDRGQVAAAPRSRRSSQAVVPASSQVSLARARGAATSTPPALLGTATHGGERREVAEEPCTPSRFGPVHVRKGPAGALPGDERRRAAAPRDRAPVLSPGAVALVNRVRVLKDKGAVWPVLDAFARPGDAAARDDFLAALLELRRQCDWTRVAEVCEWWCRGHALEPDATCVNLLMDAHVRLGRPERAEAAFRSATGGGGAGGGGRPLPAEPTVVTFNVLMSAFARAGHLAKAEKLFEYMRAEGYGADVLAFNSLLEILGRHGQVARAAAVFAGMAAARVRPSTNTYTIMISIYGRADQADKARAVFDSMRAALRPPDLAAYTALVGAFARGGFVPEAGAAFQECLEAGYAPDVDAYNALLAAHSRAGDAQAAAEIFGLIRRHTAGPDRASYTLLMDAYGRRGRWEDAEKVFEDMKAAGFVPTLGTQAALLGAYARAALPEKVELSIRRLEEQGGAMAPPGVDVYNCLLLAYGAARKFGRMEALLREMKKGGKGGGGSPGPNIRSYNTVIAANADAGLQERAEELFAEALGSEAVRPDADTWTALMRGYAAKKLFRKCAALLRRMAEAGCAPGGATREVLLGACRSPEQVREAEELLRWRRPAAAAAAARSSGGREPGRR